MVRCFQQLQESLMNEQPCTSYPTFPSQSSLSSLISPPVVPLLPHLSPHSSPHSSPHFSPYSSHHFFLDFESTERDAFVHIRVWTPAGLSLGGLGGFHLFIPAGVLRGLAARPVVHRGDIDIQPQGHGPSAAQPGDPLLLWERGERLVREQGMGPTCQVATVWPMSNPRCTAQLGDPLPLWVRGERFA